MSDLGMERAGHLRDPRRHDERAGRSERGRGEFVAERIYEGFLLGGLSGDTETGQVAP